ncbi:aminotransferase class IV [Desulfobacula toluolica]|uniref:branched-chain-amino-acid transaminase n=1 Tax=Desulfobacula toluolica (strain DSM 7467 / Tol2) TaxID=651182 RepID=K0NPP0_DESTT|nr:aminotransferase class IV [Desulfobacula toluolica]CCK82098.1 Dat: predicted D-alanine aminotransferase [Desulfobacula toluolica Tol2]
MKREAIHNFFVANQIIKSTADMAIFDKVPATAIYEVMQVRQGIPLFFEAHLERFVMSASLVGTRIPKKEAEILHNIADLVEKNKCDHGNVKLVSALMNEKEIFLAYFIPAEFLDSKARLEGVHTILFSGERICPNIKTIKGSFREQVKAVRESSNAYEALLVNESGHITEGSRSNVFFMGKDNKLYTSPAGSVLKGVTRTHVMQICSRLGLEVLEKTVHTRNLADIQGAFITGTTVDVTPVRSIGNTQLDSPNIPLIRKIVAEYEKKIAGYVSKRLKRARKVYVND